MWLACASNSPRALKITDVLKTDRVDVMTVFLMHFDKFWKRERYEYESSSTVTAVLVRTFGAASNCF